MKDFTISENLRGFDLTFKTTYDLFSYKAIDEGTKLLIKVMDVNAAHTLLDLGCGYGPVGIVMAKLNPRATVYMVDRDFVAVEYTKQNVEINKIDNAEVLLSNGFSNLQHMQFDVIASNLPTHIAKESLTQMLQDAKKALRKNGRFYLVTTSRLKPFIDRLLTDVFGSVEKIEQRGEYVVSLVTNS